ncbi:MAG TPA: SCO family protein [Alphaproteobacteria bacterium]|jgi:protein SCO1/2|nr:SCO family protein [Alphaproteobacteria bacterium]
MRRRLILLSALAAIAAVLAGLATWQLRPRLEAGGGTGVADIGGPFTLVDQDGRTVTEQDFRGKFMLVYFGYTFCPDVCPTELQSMVVAMDDLGADAEQVQPIFVTVDPARDTVAVIHDYVRAFSPTLVGLTGSDSQVRAAAKAWRVYFAKGKEAGGGAYLMDHSSFVYLMGPDGRYLTHFAPRTPPEEMAKRIRGFL